MFKLTYFVFLLWWGYLADTCELAGMQLPHLPPSNWSVLPSHLIATFITTRALLFFIFLSWWKKWGKPIAECWSISNKYAIEVLPRLVCKRLGWHRYDIKWGGFFFLNWAEAHDTSSHVIDWRNRNIRFRPTFCSLSRLTATAMGCRDKFDNGCW